MEKQMPYIKQKQAVETSDQQLKQERAVPFGSGASHDHDPEDGLQTSKEKAPTPSCSELEKTVINVSDASTVRSHPDLSPESLNSQKTTPSNTQNYGRLLSREKNLPYYIRPTKEDDDEDDYTTGEENPHVNTNTRPGRLWRSLTFNEDIKAKKLHGKNTGNVNQRENLPLIRESRGKDSKFDNYTKHESVQIIGQSPYHKMSASDVYISQNRSQNLDRSSLNSPQQNTRPSTAHSLNSRNQMEFSRLDSKLTKTLLKNERLSVENENLQEKIKELEKNQYEWISDKKNYESRLFRLNNECLNLKRTHKKELNDFKANKNIEIEEMLNKCKIENVKEIKDLRGKMDDELKFERTERNKEETKYQNLYVSNEILQKSYDETVQRENKKDADYKEKLDIKNKELEDARAEINKLKHESKIAANDHKVALREMTLIHESEIDRLRLENERNLERREAILLQRENTILRENIERQNPDQPKPSKICSLS